jgi:hypothetical protein
MGFAGGARSDATRALRTAEEEARQERRAELVRLVRIAGWLMLTAALCSVPAALVLDPQPPVTDFVLPLATSLGGIALLLVPARWMADWWIYAIIGAGTAACAAGVAVFGGDYSFYFVIPAIYAAYALPTRRQFAAALVVLTLALFAPHLYRGGDETMGHSEHAEGEGEEHPSLVTLPVMLIGAIAVRELRDTLQTRQRVYRNFAGEALELAARIQAGEQTLRRGELDPATQAGGEEI